MAKDPAAAFNFDGSLDGDSVKVLGKALASADKSRFSYLEFRLAVLKLLDKGMSLRDAYESVFITAETIGVDRQQLLMSANTYLETLEAEKTKFSEAMEKRLTEGISADLQRMEKLQSQLEKLAEQQKQIEEKIAQGKARYASLEADLEAVRIRVKERGEKFVEAYTGIKQQVAKDLSEMKDHHA